jgi:hypothetical protein
MAPLLATILISTTGSYSSTGGNTAGPGGMVVNGPSQSSAYTVTNVGGSDSDYYYSDNGVNITNTGGTGSATVHIETDNNGQVQQETVTKPIPPGGNVDIEIATSSGNSYAATVIKVGSGSSVRASTSLTSLRHAIGHLLKAASSSTTTALSIEATATGPNFAQLSFGAKIAAFFQRVFNLFGF